MALVLPSKIDGLIYLLAWRNIQPGDICEPAATPDARTDLTIHLTGILGKGEVTIEASLDGVAFSPLSARFDGKLIKFKKDDEPRMVRAIPRPRFVRPVILKPHAAMNFSVIVYCNP